MHAEDRHRESQSVQAHSDVYVEQMFKSNLNVTHVKRMEEFSAHEIMQVFVFP